MSLLTEMNSQIVVITSADVRVSPQPDPSNSGCYAINAAAALALSMAAPVIDGVTVIVTSGSAFAHTIGFAGALADGAAHVTTLTFAAQIGASAVLKSYNKRWNVIALQGVTAS